MTLKEYSGLYDRLYLPLCMYALRLLSDREEARDAVQDTFVAVWKKLLHEQMEIADLKSYLYRAVYNRSLSILRSRRESAGIAEEILLEVPSEEEIDTSERDAALWRAIGELPERCREVFLLSKRDGLTNHQIAEQLGISIKTVENQMTKAYTRLRPRLRRSLGPVCFLPFLF